MTINLFLIKCCYSHVYYFSLLPKHLFILLLIIFISVHFHADLYDGRLYIVVWFMSHKKIIINSHSPWTVNLANALSLLATMFDATHRYFPSSVVCTLFISKLPPSTIRSRVLRFRISSKSIQIPSCEQLMDINKF